VFLLGSTGMGKSSFMVQIALEDAKNGHGMFFLYGVAF
jgi:putative ribosome biogenesis GTPase RsgA